MNNACDCSIDLQVTRRSLLRRCGALAAGWLVAGALPFPARLRVAGAAEPQAPSLGPDEALRRLLEGNRRYVRGESTPLDFAATRAGLAHGQSPHSIVLGCSDSRVSPEFAFDQGRGDLFVVRVAGNFVSPDGLASIEYAVKYLGSSLILVLGHTRCGALGAAVQFVRDKAELPGHLPELVAELAPAVTAAQAEPGDLLGNAIRANVVLNVARMKAARPIVSELVAAGKVKVAGGIYDLETGKVDLVA